MAPQKVFHPEPPKEYYLVYYGNGYEVLIKRFTALEYAIPFMTELEKEKGLFYFLELRKVVEETSIRAGK